MYDLLHNFLEIDFSPLFRFRIFEKLDYVDLIPIFKHKDFFKSFLHSLNKFVYSFKVLFTHHNKCIEYYRKIWPYLLINSPDVLQLNNFELYLEIDPYILFDLKILECFGISFTIALLEKAEIWYFQRFFRDLQKLVSSATISTFNDEFIKEIIPFLHIVGKYLTSTIKEKILEFLKNYFHTISLKKPSKYNYYQEGIEIVNFLFYLRWNLFFKSDEKIKLQKILKKDNLLLNKIHQRFVKRNGLLFINHTDSYVLVNYYKFIEKEGVLKLLERIKPRNIIFFLKYLDKLTNYVTCPINQYFEMASKEIQRIISNDFKILYENINDDEKEKDLDLNIFFNKSIIVHEYAEKPCHFMSGCPYGPLVECFKPRLIYDKSSCKAFDRDCPAFYISEFVNENMDKVPPKDTDLEKLTDNIKKCDWFNNSKIIAEYIEKPCYELGWCPYGSLGDEFSPREINNKFECKIYAHNCPVFYLFEYPNK